MANLKPGWRRVKFGDVVRQVKDKVDPATSGLERFIAGEHMDTDDLRIRRWGDVGDGYLGPAFHMRFRPGHVLYGSRRTYLRKVAVADFEGICANTTFVMESANPEVLLPEFFPFVMQTESFHEHSKRESKGSVNPYVNFSDLAWYEFALPPMEEQRRALALLNHTRIACEAAVTLASRTGQLRRAWLNTVGSNLLMDRAIEVPLGDLLQDTPESGCSAPERDEHTGHWVLGLSALSDSGYVPGQLKAVDPSPMMKSAILLDGDLLISRSNTRERVGFVGRFVNESCPVSFPDTMMRLRVKTDLISAEFLELLLQAAPLRARLQAIAAGTSASMKKLNKANLIQVRVVAPSREIQQSLLDSWNTIGASERSASVRAGQMRVLYGRLLAEVLTA